MSGPAPTPVPIPVMVLTGFLGAGKTTLLNRILGGGHGRRYAVIVNEFGAIGIDNELIVSAEEELFEMSNGCVCCTVRGDLVRTLHQLLGGGRAFDGIIVETTGLADPGPVVQTFLVDPLLQARTELDSVTTVVDAANLGRHLEDGAEAARQIAFADQIVLNKAELAAPDHLRALESRLRALNPLAPIHRASRGEVALERLLGRRGFSLEHIRALEPELLQAPVDEPGHVHDEHCGHDHHHDHEHATHGHVEAAGISSVSLLWRKPLDGAKFGAWLDALVAREGRDLLRSKGIVDVQGEARRLVFHSVHMLLEGDWQRPWQAQETRCSKLVFIGRGLDEQALRAGVAACEAA